MWPKCVGAAQTAVQANSREVWSGKIDCCRCGPRRGFELRSALIVDQTRYRVREGPLPRVFAYFRANRIAMHQPSRAELQDGIQPFAKRSHLFVSDGTEIRTCITPGRHQRSILKQQDAVVDHRRKVQ